MPAELAHSADKIKFLEQNICLHCSIKLHDAGQRFQLVVPWSVRPYEVCFFRNYLNLSDPVRVN